VKIILEQHIGGEQCAIGVYHAMLEQDFQALQEDLELMLSRRS